MFALMKTQPKESFRKVLMMSTAMFFLAVAGCASVPPLPTDQIARAEAAINRAEEARVADYASVELRAAREKLSAARDMMLKATAEKDKNAAVRAAWLAEQSISDAELATAKAQYKRAQEVNKELEGTVDMLQQERQQPY
jgi:hypothetical protein